MIEATKEGRRIYFTGNTFPVKNEIKALGAKWDGERKAWWVGSTKAAEVEALVAKVNGGAGATATSGAKATVPGEDARVIGRATYKGKTYYMAPSADGGAVTTRDGSKMLLFAKDGSFQFWAATNLVSDTKYYSQERTIRSLREYAKSAAAGVSYSDYVEFLDMLDQMDSFAEEEAWRKRGYAAWKTWKQGEVAA